MQRGVPLNKVRSHSYFCPVRLFLLCFFINLSFLFSAFRQSAPSQPSVFKKTVIGLFLLASLIWFHSQPICVRKCVLTFEKCVLSSWFFFLFSQKHGNSQSTDNQMRQKVVFFFKKTIQGFKRGHTMCWICTFSAGYMSLTICSSRNDICSIEPSPCPPLRVLISSQS